MKLILASGSPRRSEILSSLGLSFTVIRPEADESSTLTDPAELTEELSLRKAREAASMLGDSFTSDTLILSCDTVVYCDGEILGKPQDKKDARRMLRLLSGKAHSVVSGFCLATKDKTVTSHEETRVFFSELSEDDIEFCINYGDVLDKAGAYAVQGMMSLWISRLEGDYFNVVGLPVCKLFMTLRDEFSVDLTHTIVSSKHTIK